MKALRWFVAGALAVPLFHQVALVILNALEFIERQPFAMTPTAPFGVPQVISLSFWGGVWGILLCALLARRAGAQYWLIALFFGAIAPTLVAAFVVAPLKGQSYSGIGPKMLAVGLIVNAAWGIGTALLNRLMSPRVMSGSTALPG